MTPALGLALPLAGSGSDPARFLAELLDEVRAADSAGFDLCLIPEHHHGPPVSIVAPLALSAAVAALTERIRVGPGILVLPVHSPVHVAEQVTMIDQLSNGRAVLGVGAGYQGEDFQPFGIDPSTRGARFEAALGAVAKLLSGPEGVNPPPVQKPRPPIWVGAWSGVGVRRAARLADGWIADPIRTVSEVARMADCYRERLEGRSGTVIVMREAWVDERADARERFADVITPVFRYYHRRGAARVPDDFDELAHDRFVMGSPTACLEQVHEIAARTGASTVVLSLRHPGGPEHQKVLEGIAALGAVHKAVT